MITTEFIAERIAKINENQLKINELKKENTLLYQEIKNLTGSIITDDTRLIDIPDFPIKANLFFYHLASKRNSNSVIGTYEKGYDTKVSDLEGLTKKELLSIRNIGPKKIKHLEEWMKKYGLKFSSED